ncbi:T9SS type A sorting domain-containing protein [Dyadobacter sp. CY312]|uniref:T9SS type A sorting domain-containing protein n=1 Tax=Dyadobacter sp. CY312 TaxID=2907303 RepID=UPI001F289B7E|nr:T9SS type A sorting domain-containing protein [Dyadobacter sp. CY312]MCE7039143.1 T9SS type A sorting domain-containing protein [Dyadobacter sp. CY312]
MKPQNIWARLIAIIFVTLLLNIPIISFAQTGAGSATVDNSVRTSSIGETTFEYSETLYLGPNAVWNISGTHIIYSKYIWIAPTAVIEYNGVGSIVIANPDENPFYPDMTGPTTIDGNNGSPIGAIVKHQNPNNIILADIQDPGYGTANPLGSLAAGLHFQNDFIFEVDGGDILLNGNDLTTSGLGQLQGFGPNRMVSTGNSVTGHLIRLNSAAVSTTYFPVGIAEGDYTPAYITGANDYHVAVTDYPGSGLPISEPQEGMDRAWHIYGGEASGIGLQHNSPDTDGSMYVDADAFITRYQGGTAWTTGLSEQIATGIHYNNGATAAGIPSIATADGAWLTKASAETPLPVTLAAFKATREGGTVLLHWETTSERNNRQFDIERSSNGKSWSRLGSVMPALLNGNSDTRLTYQFIDSQSLNGLNYYRLKQIDLDGSYSYSQIRTVQMDGAMSLKVYPNPAISNIQLMGLKGNAGVCVFDNLGRQVLNLDNVRAGQSLSINKLQAGLYHLLVTEQSGAISHLRFVK